MSAAGVPPLDPSKEEIRLVTLHPPLEGDSALRCTFSHISFLNDTCASLKPPSYETLSYVWGQPDFSDSIIVNNQQLHITPSLATILPNLRLEAEPRLLWIDAICINQKDLVERAQQVKLMRKIYSSCRRVLAWVGPTQVTVDGVPFEHLNVEPEYWRRQAEQLQCLEKEQVDRLKETQREEFEAKQKKVAAAMELLRKIIDRDLHTLGTLEENYAREHRSLDSHKEVREREEEHPGSYAQSATTKRMQLDDEAYVLASLLRYPRFWGRVWIVQEMSCAPQVTLLCGRAELEWAYISEFFKDEPYFDAFHAMEINHGRRYRNKKLFRRIFTNAKVIEDQRRTICKSVIEPANTFLDVLTRFRDKKAADPRDKIYALLGLVSQRHGIDVDYNKTLERLYQEVTLALIRISGNLDIICQNPFEYSRGLKHLREIKKRDFITPHGRRETMPSWTADFRLGHDQCFPVMFAQRNIFNAGLRTESVVFHVVGKHMNVLALRGTVLDRIGSTFPDWWGGIYSQSRAQSDQDKSRVDSVLQRTSLHDGRRGYSARHILRSIYENSTSTSAANFGHAPTSGKNAIESSEDPESPTRALWRTLVRDCTAPPKMRRLMKKEIDELDAMNSSSIKAGQPPHTCETTDDAPNKKMKSTELPWEDEEHYVFAVSLNGFYLLTRRFAEVGDVIAVLDGGKVPVILRNVKSDGAGKLEQAYEFVCIAYVHGIMDGEVEEAVARGWLQKKEILLA